MLDRHRRRHTHTCLLILFSLFPIFIYVSGLNRRLSWVTNTRMVSRGSVTITRRHICDGYCNTSGFRFFTNYDFRQRQTSRSYLPIIASLTLESTGRIFFSTSSMGPGLWAIFSFKSSASRALFNFIWVAWREGSAKVSGEKNYQRLKKTLGSATQILPSRFSACV